MWGCQVRDSVLTRASRYCDEEIEYLRIMGDKTAEKEYEDTVKKRRTCRFQVESRTDKQGYSMKSLSRLGLGVDN